MMLNGEIQQQKVRPEDMTVLAQQAFSHLDISDATRIDYGYRIGAFLAFIGQNGLHPYSYLEYKRHLGQRTDIAIATKNKYLAPARVYLKELHRLGYLPSDLTINVKSFQQDKKHKRDGLNDEEIEKLAGSLRGGKGPEYARVRVLICLLALQGLRQVEVSRLDIEDVLLERRLLLVRGKARDDKEPVDLQPETTDALREYLSYMAQQSGPLFRSQSNSSSGKRLSTRSIREIVRDVMAANGINKTTHGFRHYYTTRLIKVYKGDLLEVAHYTRHRSLEMLQVYNDRIRQESDLPRYYGAFEAVKFHEF